LGTYYDYLKERLSLPFEAKYHEEEEGFFNPLSARRVKVVALDRELYWDKDEGILCQVQGVMDEQAVPLVELELRRTDPNRRLVDEYVAWFVGDLSEDDVDEYGDDDEEPERDEKEPEFPDEATWRSVVLLLLEITAFATSFGAVVGAAVAVMPWARWAACIGGSVWGVFVAVAHVRYTQKDMRFVLPRLYKRLNGIIGLVTGAVQGVFFGIMAVAFIGAILGGIVGVMLRRLFRGKKWLVLRTFPNGVMFAVACGVTVQAFYIDHAGATTGLWHGTLIGLGSDLFLCLVALPLAFLAIRRR
jgi:hypothetical protein